MNNLVQLFCFDIVGSASYKVLRQNVDGSPGWVEAFQCFFEELPLIFTAEIARVYFEEPGDIPAVPVWKTIGDEIVFMAHPQKHRDVQLLTQACVAAMAKGNSHFQNHWGLQIHGVTWSIELGVRNRAIRFRELESHSKAVMDVIGPDIDLGFRLTTHAPAGGVLVTESHANSLTGSSLKVALVGQCHLKGIQLEAYPLLLVTEK